MAEELKRGFGYWTILALSISAILGTTLFFGTGIGARYSGNLLIVAWIILSLVALYVASVFGELTAMFPRAGGAYEFSKQAYGKFASFLIAWTAWLFGSISTVIIIIAAVTSLDIGLSQFGGFLLSVAIIVLLNAIAYLGTGASSLTLALVGIIIVGVPLAIIVKGFFALSPANFSPFFTHKFSSVFVTLFFMAEAYFGWEAATYLAEETKDPRKVIPKAIMHATAIIGVLGLLMIIVTLGIIPWQQLAGTEAPFSELAGMLYGRIGSVIVVAVIFVALIGTATATIISMPRLLLALARDNLFLGQFSKLHPRFKTPHNAILFQTVILVMLLLLGLANYIVLLELLIPLGTVLYISMIIALVLLRRKLPAHERPFRSPFTIIGAPLAILFFLAIVLSWLLSVAGAGIVLQTSLSLILLGVPLYFMVELYYDPKMITQANDLFAYATFFLQKLTGSGSLTRRKVISFLGSIKGKTILEYGCGVGSLTLKLLEAVGPSGTVYATHFANNNIKITRKRVEVKKWETERWVYGSVKVIHDPEQMRRVHPDVGYADAIVSVGILSYVQDIKKVLREMYAIMPVGGKLCFVEHSDFFHILPNVEWLSSDRYVEHLFSEAGFSVSVSRKTGLFWNTIYVYGIKLTGGTRYI